MLKQKVEDIHKQALQAISEAPDSKSLYQVKVAFLGKRGELSLVMGEMKNLPSEERPAFGQLVNTKKKDLQDQYEMREQVLRRTELDDQIQKEKLDLTLPGPVCLRASRHPVQKVRDEIVQILSRIGFSVRTGPMIEKDEYNFEALNIPADHPARDEQDTFYINKDYVLRTHTSPVQIRTMLNEKPPIRVIAPGSVFRCDHDVSHSPNFHQIEALYVDKKVSMSELKGTISYFVKAFFGADTKIRFRPSFFPFTEPSAEVDCSCPLCRGKGCRVCKHSGWIEIGGSGLVHPRVLEYVNLNPKEWQGYALGFGLERMAIIKYGINDIRLFSENDLRFLNQF